MQKSYTGLIIALSYIASVLAALIVAVNLPEYIPAVIIFYALFVVVSALTLHGVMKRNERIKLAKQRSYLSDIVQSLNAMAIIWESNFHEIEVNSELTTLTGYTADDLRDNARNIQKLLPKDAFAPSLQAIINNRDEEFFVTTKTGAKVCTIWNTSLMFVEKRGKDIPKYILLSIGHDLSENAKMKEELTSYANALAASESRFTMSMEYSGVGLMLKDANDYRLYTSKQFRQMGGFDTEFIGFDELKALIHPDDRVVVETLRKAMTAKTPSKSGEIYSVEFRMKPKNSDSYRWLQYRYKVTPCANILMATIGGAVIDINDDKEKDLIIEKMAYIDEVTQIYNRNKFIVTGEETFKLYDSIEGQDLDYWIIIFDIDDFHIINDTCGYQNGNMLLRGFASIINKTLGESDLGARIGGDNFAIIVKDNGDEELPINLVKRIQKSFAAFSEENFSTQAVTCSAGYCKMSDGGNDFLQVLDRAEFALSHSDGTKGSIVRYDREIHDQIIKSNEIEKELANAIENNELVLYYQPKIDLNTGVLTGMEALIRWIKPDGTIVPPGSFIPVAESSMLITKISRFVLHEACRQNKEWQDKGYPPITVSINLTAVDFYQTNVTESIKKALDETGMEPQWLDVELTESLALKDIDHAVAQMNEIKSLGIKLSMDDFGTGYSSLSYIQILPITLLKLDRSFVMYLEDDEISREIVSAVIRIAKSKKIETIAEGIETPGQVDILKQSGCDLAQGYFFGKPMPADKFEEFMKMKAEQSRQQSELSVNVQ
ncbi:MAG: EAL domain-containing protein [Oscillospiraceae bacterium]